MTKEGKSIKINKISNQNYLKEIQNPSFKKLNRPEKLTDKISKINKIKTLIIKLQMLIVQM